MSSIERDLREWTAEGGNGRDAQREGPPLGRDEAGPVPQEQQRPQPDLQQDEKRRAQPVTAEGHRAILVTT